MNKNKEEILNKLDLVIADELENVRKNDDKKEMIEKANVLFNIHKILNNYDDLEPVLQKYFFNKRFKRKDFCEHENMDCEVEKRGCEGCYYEKL